MNRKHKQSIYHANVNVNLMIENAIHINGGITINVDVCKKRNVCEKNMFRIPLHAVVKMGNIKQVLWIIQRLFVMKLYNYARKKQILTKKNNV